MNIWSLLGIEPTRDLAKIKAAYAAQVKVHHPEDDPEGFKRLRDAYKIATAMAKSGKPEPQLPGEEYTEAQGQQGFDFANNQQKAQGPPQQEDMPEMAEGEGVNFTFMAGGEPGHEPGKPGAQTGEPTEEFDFAEAEQALQQNQGQQKMADQMMQRIKEIYFDQKKRKSSSAWKKIFSSGDFLRMRESRYFVTEFVSFFRMEGGVPPGVWHRVFVPMLQEWSYLFPGKECGQILAAALAEIPEAHRIARSKRFTPKQQVGLFMLIMAVIILLNAISKQWQQARTPAALPYSQLYQTTPIIDNDILKDSLPLPLPLSGADVDYLVQEQATRAGLLVHMQEGLPAATAAEAEALELGEEQCAELDRLVANGEQQQLQAYIEALRPYEKRLIQEKVLPVFKAEILKQSSSIRSWYFIYLLGVGTEHYEELVEEANTQGEEWLEEQLAAYDRFTLEAEELRSYADKKEILASTQEANGPVSQAGGRESSWESSISE